ncbi:hypothetical protein [Piscinibacter defluvii]|uniref:hypothetical protein n=1 Tax=Piscinibacter defluvii TaxID=1796922 RepID=UPI000FDE1341|nr:hypothetical protein [Piscinibacter defluvii]
MDALSLIANALEVLSDIVGAVGALVLLAPTGRLIETRRELEASRRSLQLAENEGQASHQQIALLREQLRRADERADEYDPVDRRRLRQGLVLVAASFAIKLGFHLLDKAPLDWLFEMLR